LVVSPTRGVQASERSSPTRPHLVAATGSWRPGVRAGGSRTRPIRPQVGAPHSRGIRVLIVVRHRLFAEALRTILEEEGMEILVLPSSVSEALAAIWQDHPDLVLLDLDLPGGQALELSRTILGKGCEAKVVALTTVSHPSVRGETVPSGLDGYVSKDLSPSDFIEAIRTALRADGAGARVPGGRLGDGPAAAD
jgi:CheY-like chemotaxis protein